MFAANDMSAAHLNNMLENLMAVPLFVKKSGDFA
jgi:hypothetical protein